MKTFYLTTPIYYPNARPHVGSAYTTIVCDVLARYKRMCGYDVAFLTGTDEHGEKLQRAAAEAGKSPAEFVAEKRQLFVDLWKRLGIDPVVYPYEGLTPDSVRFIYTDHPDHFKSVRRMLLRARANRVDGQEIIYKKQYQGRYCIFDEMYVSDGSDPINCPNCGRPTELISEENYFFRLSAYKEKLLALYEAHPYFVQPGFRMNEVKNFVKDLRDISISRKRIKWGIPFPLDEDHDDPEQVFYVWYDALVSYMTGIGYAHGDEGNAAFRKYWRNVPGESELVHMVGKDILRFHAIYWPAFIMAAYPGQPEMLPTTIFAHGWIYYEQDKMSKSKGNVVYPEPIVDAFESFGAPGNDALRYYLFRGQRSPGGSADEGKAPDRLVDAAIDDQRQVALDAESRQPRVAPPTRMFGLDTSFSYKDLIQRYNSDLANDLGNLASRTIAMIDRYCEGKVPPGPAELGPPHDHVRLRTLQNASTDDPRIKFFRDFFEELNFSRGLDVLWQHIGLLNHYVHQQQPWALAKSESAADHEKASVVLYTAAEALRFLSVLLYSVLPTSASLLWKQLGCEEYLGKIEAQRIDQLKWGDLKPGTKIGKPEPIFPRLDKAKTLAKLEELAELDRERTQPKGVQVSVPSEQQSAISQADSSSPPAAQNDKAGGGQAAIDNRQSSIPSSESRVPSPAETAGASGAKITIDDFAKIDLRAGTILAAESIPGAKKLLKLQVDIGSETRQVCAGIAEFYRPEELVGMKIVLVANLEPRKLRGIESNGMVVAASIGPVGKPVLATFKEDVPNGAKLK
ncbi:MAG TPA: methionine--tRNA ligase subunit beta [Terriglobia bacterium]|nr:methionine--tRNA ligase subunit beta [Terriglobia bacterium]